MRRARLPSNRATGRPVFLGAAMYSLAIDSRPDTRLVARIPAKPAVGDDRASVTFQGVESGTGAESHGNVAVGRSLVFGDRCAAGVWTQNIKGATDPKAWGSGLGRGSRQRIGSADGVCRRNPLPSARHDVSQDGGLDFVVCSDWPFDIVRRLSGSSPGSMRRSPNWKSASPNCSRPSIRCPTISACRGGSAGAIAP